MHVSFSWLCRLAFIGGAGAPITPIIIGVKPIKSKVTGIKKPANTGILQVNDITAGQAVF